MPPPRYVPKVTSLQQVRGLIELPEAQVFWAIHTTWWTVRRGDLGRLPAKDGGPGLPCDPRGSVLMQGEAEEFLRNAEASPGHYGKHGLTALVAAYHGNLVTLDGQASSVRGWDAVNEILDRALARAERVVEVLR